MLLSAAFALVAATQLANFQEPIERFRRLIPADFDAAEQTLAIQNFAAKAELKQVQIRFVPEVERNLPLEIHRIDVSGRGSYPDVHFFLNVIRYRVRGIESLRLDADGGDSVRFAVRLITPTWSDTPIEYGQGVLDTILAVVSRVQDDRGLDALAAFTRAVQPHPIALTSVRIGDAMTIEGLLLGAAARKTLVSSLTEAGLRVTRLDPAGSGPCGAFSAVVTRAPQSKGESLQEILGGEFTPGSHVFDEESASLCRGEPDTPARAIVAGDATKQVFLRLRDTELADVFFILNDLIAHNFLVDEDVKGRVNLDFYDGAAIEDGYRALESAGLAIGAAPLRRVSRGKPAPASAAPQKASGGEPITLSFRNADLASVLCLLGELSGREIRMPGEPRRRVTVFANEVPLATFDQLVPPPGSSPVNACQLSSTLSGPRITPNVLTLEAIGIADLRLAGIAHFGETWKAYAYGPGRRLFILDPGARLFDGSLKAIGPNGVTFAPDGKDVVEAPLTK